jgi:hypothetical protein
MGGGILYTKQNTIYKVYFSFVGFQSGLTKVFEGID